MNKSFKKRYVALTKEVDGNSYYHKYTSDLENLLMWAFFQPKISLNIEKVVLYEIKNVSKQKKHDIMESLEYIKKNFLINSNLEFKKIEEKEPFSDKIKILTEEYLKNIKIKGTSKI